MSPALGATGSVVDCVITPRARTAFLPFPCGWLVLAKDADRSTCGSCRLAPIASQDPRPFNWNNGGIDRIALSELAPGE